MARTDLQKRAAEYKAQKKEKKLGTLTGFNGKGVTVKIPALLGFAGSATLYVAEDEAECTVGFGNFSFSFDPTTPTLEVEEDNLTIFLSIADFVPPQYAREPVFGADGN